MTPEGPTLVNERVQQRRRGLVFFSFENFGLVLGFVKQRPKILCGSKHFTRSSVINSGPRVKIDPLWVIVIIWDEIKPAELAAVVSGGQFTQVESVSGP